MAESGPLLAARELRIGYRGAPPLAPPLSFQVEPGQIWGIVGPNGSGKTTLLRTLLGLHGPRGGHLERQPGLRVGYVPQRGQADPVFPVSALDVVLMGMAATAGPFRPLGTAHRDAALGWLERVGLATAAHQPFRRLSGGQRQRAMIARALAAEPALLALDEPGAGMDLAGEADLMALVARLRRETGVAVLLVTHALSQAAALADHLVLFHGESGHAEVGAAAELLAPARLQQIYGREVAVRAIDGVTLVYLPERG